MSKELEGAELAVVIKHLQEMFLEPGETAWPGNLTEEEQVAFASLHKNDFIAFINVDEKYARESIKRGTLEW